MTQVVSTYVPRAHAVDFHARAETSGIMVMHRRAGKTVMCINDLIDKAIQCQLEMPEYAYVAPFYKQAKRVAWRYLKLFTRNIRTTVLESELAVILSNGARIQLYGADNPDSLRGMYLDGVILDEYGDMSPVVYSEVVSPMLLDRDGWIVFIGTPKGPNHFYDLWKQATEPGSGWFTKMLRASESGVFTDEQLAKQRALPGTDEETFEQEFECSFTAAIRGSYYGKMLNELEAAGHMGSFPWDPEKPVILAFDIGYTDDTAIWFVQTNGREVSVIDFFGVSGYSVEDVMAELQQRPYAYGTFYLPHDAKNKSFQTGKSTRELMTEAGAETMLVPNLSLQDGIQAVRTTLPQMYFNTENPEVRFGLDAARLYQREWDDKKQAFRQSPRDDWTNHAADALRMLALALNPVNARRAAASIVVKRDQTLASEPQTLDDLWAARESNVVSLNSRRI